MPTRTLRASSVPQTANAPAIALALACTLALLLASGCGDDGTPPIIDTSAGRAEAATKPDPNVQPVARRANERPLPAFDGRTLTGERLSISSLIGKRLVLFFFNPEVESAEVVSRAVASIAVQRAEFNFNMVGIAIGSNGVTAGEFVAKQGFDFPVIDDSAGRITAKLGLRSPVMILSVDPEGFLGDLAIGSFKTDSPDAWKSIASQIREKLRIPEPRDTAAGAGALDQRPFAPAFETIRLAGGDSFKLASLEGKPLVLIFFLHTCPHCHAALRFIQEQRAAIAEDKRPALVGISIANRASDAEVRASLREKKIELDDFTILADPSGSVANEYGVFGGVPVIYLIDGNGRITRRFQGWEEGREQALMRMQLAQIAGERIPMLLNPKGYTGADACGVCHVDEYNSWLFTEHSSAYDTLVTHGQEREAECVSCHVAGFDQPGGFSLADRPHHLENVGCENCHGRGGPHLSPGFMKTASYESACLTCHNKEHSLGFEYATFVPKVSHKAIAGRSAAERETMLAAHGKPRDVLPQAADHVGSNACRSCHASEFATWSQSDHAHAGETLTKANKAGDATCLACHTTGFGRTGGFPASATLAEHPTLSSVGCESCHGPGSDHVKDGAPKLGTIVSLGDKCDSCVILQICGRCHDDVNDPGFTFEVEEKIERQRHGTIEAGTGKPIGDSAGAHHPPRVETELARVFSLLDSASRTP